MLCQWHYFIGQIHGTLMFPHLWQVSQTNSSMVQFCNKPKRKLKLYQMVHAYVILHILYIWCDVCIHFLLPTLIRCRLSFQEITPHLMLNRNIGWRTSVKIWVSTCITGTGTWCIRTAAPRISYARTDVVNCSTICISKSLPGNMTGNFMSHYSIVVYITYVHMYIHVTDTMLNACVTSCPE